jgi:DNA-binding MarR family transcriptional regulator
MDSYLSNNHNSSNNFAAAPVLIVGDTSEARARACSTVAMSGLRAAGAVGIAEAEDRISSQVSASALWIELEAVDPKVDVVLSRVASDVGHQRYPAVLSVRRNILEHVEAHALDSNIDVIVDANASERAAALGVAVARVGAHSVNEVSGDKSAVRLRQLSDEVSRIAATLARLSTGPGEVVRRSQVDASAEVPEISLETVRGVIRARRLRSRFFREDLFADPAWDMLLDLLQAEITKLRVPVSSLCIAAAVPATTALRWLKTMVEEGIFSRQADPHDGRRVFVELAPETSYALRRYFAEVGKVSVI